MVENPEGEGQQFTPTDWDWVMFLSGEINAAETRFDTVWTASIAVMMACIGFITGLTFRITYPGSSDSILDSTSSNIVTFVDAVFFVVGAVIFVLAFYIFWITREKKRETEKRVKPLEKCREDIFSRLGDPNKINDPNKILECYLNAVGKKGDENKRWLIAIIGILALVTGYAAIVFLLVKPFWAWTIPDLFPGAVSQGLVAESISWYTAFKVAIFVAVLAGLAGAQQGRES